MTTRRLLPIATLVLLAGLWGCGEGHLIVDEGHPLDYLPQTSPENVLHNLQVSWVRREIEQYTKLLDPVYILKFQSGDVPDGLERDYWNRDEDSTMIAALFDNPDVWRINLDLGPFVAVDAGLPLEPGAKLIRLTNVKLEVEQYNGTTLLVQGDIQDMYFRQGSAAAGTDSTKWYIFEWQDLDGEWSSFLREEGK